MKTLIKKLARKMGFRVIRLSQTTASDDSSAAICHLLAGIRDPVIFDVGAHHGEVSREFRKLFPTATIYAFEPFRDSFKVLEKNTSSDPKIHVFNFGLSDKEGIQSFHSNPSSATNSLLSTAEEASRTWGKGLLETREVVEAEFKTFDSIVQSMQITRIDMLKLDVQGAEHLVMLGASESCAKGLIGLIYSEIIIQPTYSGQKRFDEALASYYNRGFNLFNIYNVCLTSSGILSQIDVIFTKHLE